MYFYCAYYVFISTYHLYNYYYFVHHLTLPRQQCTNASILSISMTFSQQFNYWFFNIISSIVNSCIFSVLKLSNLIIFVVISNFLGVAASSASIHSEIYSSLRFRRCSCGIFSENLQSFRTVNSPAGEQNRDAIHIWGSPFEGQVTMVTHWASGRCRFQLIMYFYFLQLFVQVQAINHSNPI